MHRSHNQPLGSGTGDEIPVATLSTRSGVVTTSRTVVAKEEVESVEAIFVLLLARLLCLGSG